MLIFNLFNCGTFKGQMNTFPPLLAASHFRVIDVSAGYIIFNITSNQSLDSKKEKKKEYFTICCERGALTDNLREFNCVKYGKSSAAMSPQMTQIFTNQTVSK